MGYPSIYPTGTTPYNPAKCFYGYTITHALNAGALLIEMKGAEVKLRSFHVSSIHNKMQH